ncbi:MAG: YcxB family protein [Phycisphaeraceae bacterium]|nr:YcxB family protein [Phycisphaeraceae bacterium]
MNSVTPTLPDELSIEFNHTADDYLAVLRDMFSNEPFHIANVIKQSKQARRFSLFVLSIAALLVYPAWVLLSQNATGKYLVPGVIVLLIAIANVLWKQVKSPQKVTELHVNVFRDRIKQGTLRPLLGNRTVRINVVGMQLTTDVTRELVRWEAISRVVDDVSHIFIFAHHNEGWAIPKSAFAKPEDATRFIALARTFHERSAGSAKSRLADSDELCFVCGYNLRGSDGQVCPECGVRLLLSQEQKSPNTPSDASSIRPLS